MKHVWLVITTDVSEWKEHVDEIKAFDNPKGARAYVTKCVVDTAEDLGIKDEDVPVVPKDLSSTYIEIDDTVYTVEQHDVHRTT